MAVCLIVAAASAPTDWVRGAENELRALSAQLRDRQASQEVHIVEIDAASIAAIRRWPWPRDHYARLVRQLDSAGARSIVFDVDFSSHATAEGDAAFAAAIAEARASIVMPTFSQRASEQSDRRLDALPIPSLRRSASLASASVLPDDDARVRRMVYGTVTDRVPRPSLSAQLAGAQGQVDRTYVIDFSIDPASIPRHSFVAVEEGRFVREAIEGKDILVGATAIETGDRYGVPIHGVIPGVTIQALAAETLLSGGLSEVGPIPLLLIALIFGYCILRSRNHVVLLVWLCGTSVALLGLHAVAYHLLATIAAVMPALIFVAVCGAAQGLRISQRRLKEKSLTDEESGLPNARAFARTQNVDGGLTATAFIKDFDSIQSVLGKDDIGQLVLRLAERLRTLIGTETVFRTDTRIIAWAHQGEYHALTDQFEAIDKAFHKPIEIAGRRIDVGLVFGIAGGNDLAAASRAASQAVKEGKPWHTHEDAEAIWAEQQVSLMGELDTAIELGQLDVVYQPKLALRADRIESVEALVRWTHPERGSLPPDMFIPLAEESNRIEPMTLFVLKRTIKDLREWRAGGILVSAAVNISAKLISSSSFVAAAERLLRDMDVPHDWLIFEVTESAAMRDPELAVRNLERFRDLGVAVSMDDYGTGLSTLSYLQTLPLTELKIDRAFVQNAHVERSDALLVRSTVQLAHSLGLKVVGEGVEDEECLDFLRECGCDYAQGYLISKPLAADDLATLLESYRPPLTAIAC